MVKNCSLLLTFMDIQQEKVLSSSDLNTTFLMKSIPNVGSYLNYTQWDLKLFAIIHANLRYQRENKLLQEDSLTQME